MNGEIFHDVNNDGNTYAVIRPQARPGSMEQLPFTHQDDRVMQRIIVNAILCYAYHIHVRLQHCQGLCLPAIRCRQICNDVACLVLDYSAAHIRKQPI